MVSTFLMGAQFKHHSCPVQKSNILHITTTWRCLSFHTSKVGTRGSSPCTFFFHKHNMASGAWLKSWALNQGDHSGVVCSKSPSWCDSIPLLFAWLW
jgi:hypothetical protein